jgi:hypothetical protein
MKRLSFWKKILYGSGDWGLSTTGMLRSVFYAIYLTDVVGLDARIGSFAALVGIIWDAINDPLVGMISDRVRTKRGRRLPFLLWFGIPFGLSFVLLWWAPPWKSQAALAVHITLAFIVADTLSTLISIPFYSLTPELTASYDERTTLTSFRTFFQLTGALAVVIFAPMIVDAALQAGLTQQQGFVLVGTVFGGLAIPPYLIMPFIFKAVIAGLKARPAVNASVSGDDVLYHRDINLGMAVALDWGLIVPVIKNADDLSIVGLARAANDLANRARTKKLLPDEVQGGTFTITNPGVYGSLFGTPIINQPQVAILNIGTIEKRAKVIELPDGSDTIAVRTMGYLALSFDHRLVDGAEADAFMGVVKATLENGSFGDLE